MAGIWGASGWARWQDDLAVIRDLAVVPVGGEGVLSMVLAQLASLLPIGGRLLRATWIGAVALGIAGRLVYGIVRQSQAGQQRPNGSVAWLDSVIALLVSAIFAVSPTAQAEANRIGGSLIALVLLLVGIRLVDELWRREDARLLPLLGLVVGLAGSENHWVGATLLAIVLAIALTTRRNLSFAGSFQFVAGLTFSGVVGGQVFWLRPLSPNAWLNLGVGSLASPGTPSDDTVDSVLGWLVELARRASESTGTGIAAMGLLGLGVCALRPQIVGRHLSPLVLVLIGCFGPLLDAASFERASTSSSLALTIGLSVHAGLLVLAGLDVMRKAQLPYAQPVAPLVLVLGTTLVLRGLDRLAAPHSLQHTGAEAWVEEALGKLPPRALVLVRREAIAYRLLATRVLHGARPDVISVPAALLSRGSVAQDLLAMEPELSPLLRQLAVHGYADEYSLSRLADARPLYVELDSQWDGRLLEHLSPEPMWLGFSAHALGATDRSAGLVRSQLALDRVVKSWVPRNLDDSTSSILAGSAEQQALVLAGLGDRKGAKVALGALKRLAPGSILLEQLQVRLSRRSRGRVAVADLID